MHAFISTTWKTSIIFHWSLNPLTRRLPLNSNPLCKSSNTFFIFACAKGQHQRSSASRPRHNLQFWGSRCGILIFKWVDCHANRTSVANTCLKIGANGHIAQAGRYFCNVYRKSTKLSTHGWKAIQDVGKVFLVQSTGLNLERCATSQSQAPSSLYARCRPHHNHEVCHCPQLSGTSARWHGKMKQQTPASLLHPAPG